MGEKDKPSHLRVVAPAPPAPTPQADGAQLVLPFAEPKPWFCVVNMAHISRDSFIEFLCSMRPALAFDVRLVPSFDFDGFSRRSAFRLFAEAGCRYLDIAGQLRISDSGDPAIASGRIADELSRVLEELRCPPRCVALLAENNQAEIWLRNSIHNRVRNIGPTWRLRVLPAADPVLVQMR